MQRRDGKLAPQHSRSNLIPQFRIYPASSGTKKRQWNPSEKNHALNTRQENQHLKEKDTPRVVRKLLPSRSRRELLLQTLWDSLQTRSYQLLSRREFIAHGMILRRIMTSSKVPISPFGQLLTFVAVTIRASPAQKMSIITTQSQLGNKWHIMHLLGLQWWTILWVKQWTAWIPLRYRLAIFRETGGQL